MFMVETLTNMHVGSGETHFGVVDNLIQRHPVTRIPIIHSSGIKGALRDHFEDDTTIKPYLPELFGKDINLENPDDSGNLDYGPGHLIFFEAQMLTLPLRATENIFYNCTSVPVILDYLDQLDIFFNATEKTKELRTWLGNLDFGDKDFIYFDGTEHLEIEDYSNGIKVNTQTNLIKQTLKTLCNIDLTRLAVFNKDIFSYICTDSIPVIARNKIKDDGTSGNLFYEEALPRKTSIYFILGYDKFLKGKKSEKAFVDQINDNNAIYQFGANYSVGYGFSKLSQITV